MDNNNGSTKAVVKAVYAETNDGSQLELPTGIDSFDWSDFVQCECGSDKVGSDRHSDYCPKYIGDVK